MSVPPIDGKPGTPPPGTEEEGEAVPIPDVWQRAIEEATPVADQLDDQAAPPPELGPQPGRQIQRRRVTAAERASILEDARNTMWERATDPKWRASVKKSLAAMGIDAHAAFRLPKRPKRPPMRFRLRRLNEPLNTFFVALEGPEHE